MKKKRLLLALTSMLAIVLAMASIAAAQVPNVDPANFVKEVNNKFFPLKPGTTFFYEGMKDGIPSRNETSVTHQTRKILGVKCTQVRDQAFENGILVEDTLDWYAQDVYDNVWYFGEDSKELDAAGNVISTEGSRRVRRQSPLDCIGGSVSLFVTQTVSLRFPFIAATQTNSLRYDLSPMRRNMSG